MPAACSSGSVFKSRPTPIGFRLALFLGLLVLAPGGIAAEPPDASEGAAANANAAGDNDAIVSLAAYNVKADRIEDFGFRIGRAVAGRYPKTAAGFLVARFVPIVVSVRPNTAAAKAGLQPGDRILEADGRSTSVGLFSAVELARWRRAEKDKWAELAAGKPSVVWTLAVQARGSKSVRTVKLVVPTPPPRWGASVWHAPEGRHATITESGPLAERSLAVLDHGVATLLDDRCARVLGLDFRGGPPSDFMSGREPQGYSWSIPGEHGIIVTQFRGRTDVLLHTRSAATGIHFYLTSPSGALERAWQWPSRGKPHELAPADARIGFDHEVDLWTTKVGKVSPRWPFELKPGYDPNAIFAALAPPAAAPASEAARAGREEFRKLRPATADERALFTDAYGKLGADHDRWAYTETSRSFADRRVLVTRVDPSKPETERSTLLSVDGRPPTDDDVQRWRDNGGDTPKPLGEIPPLATLVDLTELRVSRDEPTAVTFELAVRSDDPGFPAEKLQALFRVDKTHRSFEAITVKLRDSFRVAGVVKVTDAGLELRFQAFDPALPPQPVLLKAGGDVRVLLVKLSRAFEATRTDFRRVAPFEEAAAPAK